MIGRPAEARMSEIKNLNERIEAIEDVLVAAATGDLSSSLDLSEDDALSPVEAGINQVLLDVGELLRSAQEQNRQLLETLDLARKQRATIEQLSTPIMRVWERVLVLPIVGAMDSKRADQALESLLEAVVTEQARCVILDITGVDLVDTQTATHFIKLAKATKLLGAECVISGVRPEVARTIVELGLDMVETPTCRNLEQALQSAFDVLGLSVVRRSRRHPRQAAPGQSKRTTR